MVIIFNCKQVVNSFKVGRGARLVAPVGERSSGEVGRLSSR